MPPISPDLISPTGQRIVPMQSRLVTMFAAALVEQGYSAIEAVKMSESNWTRFEADRALHDMLQSAAGEPTSREQAATRWEKYAADVALAQTKSMQAIAPAADSRMREAK